MSEPRDETPTTGDTHAGPSGSQLAAPAVPDLPVILVATSDDDTRGVLDAEMRRRYATDYEVITCRRYAHAQAILDGLRRWERDVAMILSFYGPKDPDGLNFLRRARSIHPTAKRVVVVEWGNFDSRGPIFRAIAEGHVENFLIRPERPRDEEFHGGIGDLLHDWHWAQGTSGFEAVRVIGHHDERTHMLRDAFARNHIPVGFYEAERGEQPPHPARSGARRARVPGPRPPLHLAAAHRCRTPATPTSSRPSG